MKTKLNSIYLKMGVKIDAESVFLYRKKNCFRQKNHQMCQGIKPPGGGGGCFIDYLLLVISGGQAEGISKYNETADVIEIHLYGSDIVCRFRTSELLVFLWSSGLLFSLAPVSLRFLSVRGPYEGSTYNLLWPA